MVGASLTVLTVMVKVCVADVSTPPLATPPLSFNVTLTVATPLALAAGVYVNLPVLLIAGCAENKALLLFVTVNVRICPLSFAGPLLKEVAQLFMVRAPISSFTS
ncbi:hypothetical protein SDC9_208579 [bioreactor metagenome]|uniref:Uncharacterized protein n=1 Tax=bioreactor metagenome TaxID=1076179 RepID=A0A645JBM0_9ZZZZ